jgi:hypothetical protein
MGLRGASPLTFRASGACDAIDGSDAPPGAMAQLKNLIPNPRNIRQFVPRPASVQTTNFTGFATPAKVNALLTVGSREYGMIASAAFAGHDQPYCYDLEAGAFVTIAGATAANTPVSPATTGDWEPPIMAQVGKRILITHPGYSGANKFGWIDTRSFVLATLTGDTHTNTTLDNLSGNPITLGVAVGDTVSGAGIAANTRVVSMTATAVVLSIAATATAAGVAITFTSGTSAAPLYGAGDTNTNNLAQRPVSVGQFNGRAWFAVANGVQYTDSLKPWVITNATQALTLGDDVSVTALGGLPLSSQVTGGVVQSLIAFKEDAPFWQITGDAATLDLRIDQVAGSVGTLSPLSVTPTTKGLAYISPDGLRIIDPLTGQPGEVIGANGQGVAVPFIYAVNPSRTCAAFAKNILRVSGKNGAIDAQTVQEWWYHFSLGTFTGPHDFPAALIQPCFSGEADFVMAASGIDAKLFESVVSPSASSTYTENGSAMTWLWTTSLLPENDTGNSNHLVESSMGFVMPATQILTIQAFDEAGNTLDTIALHGDGMGQSLWNAFNWGTGVWGGSLRPFQQWTMEWTQPLVFKQASVAVYGSSVSGLVIGNLLAKIQPTGYQGARQ